MTTPVPASSSFVKDYVDTTAPTLSVVGESCEISSGLLGS